MRFFKHLCVIPARYDSRRFPGKMLTEIKGKSLLQRTYENVKRSSFKDNVLIATDDVRIKKHAEELGADVVMTPKSCINGTHRVYKAIENHPKVSKQTIVLNVQGDEPLLCPKSLEKLCLAFEKDPSLNMATLAAPFKTLKEAKDPANVKCVLDCRGNALYFSRALIPYNQCPTKVYHHHGVYAFRKSFLDIYEKLPLSPLQQAEDLEQLKVLEHGYSIRVFIEKNPGFGVDLPADIKKLERLL